MGGSFTERLGERVAGGTAPACVGLDPRPDALPTHLCPDDPAPERIVAFHREVLPRIARHAPVVKPNVAFYERLGAAGWAAYEKTCRLATEAGLLVIADAKRGDIGSTAQAYAEAHFALADAITLHPWLGRDSIEPFLAGCRAGGKGVFVLVHTSNPSAAEFQDVETGAGTMAERVADAVQAWGEAFVDAHGYSAVGAVVGATFPEQLAGLRERMPRAWILVPGVGAQGGRVDDTAAAFDARGLGAIVNQSRGVLQCFPPESPDWLDQIDGALTAFAADLRRVAFRTSDPPPT